MAVDAEVPSGADGARDDEAPKVGHSLRIQVVLYLHHPGTAWRLTSALAASVRVAKEAGALGPVEVFFGDSSPASFTDDEIEELETHGRAAGFDHATYTHFAANLGSAGGSNRLARGAATDFMLVLNPDTYASPGLLRGLLRAAEDPAVGAVDARQIPLEHPKDYDVSTGETSWASGACVLIRVSAFQEVAGFDDTHFFLHCDDVDLSWRLRLAGWRVRHAPTAVVFHDKRIAGHGSIEPSDTEIYHSMRGRLLLARRYSRPDIEEETLAFVERSGSAAQTRAVTDFLDEASAGKVPAPIADAYRVAEFINGEYAVHRF